MVSNKYFLDAISNPFVWFKSNLFNSRKLIIKPNRFGLNVRNICLNQPKSLFGSISNEHFSRCIEIFNRECWEVKFSHVDGLIAHAWAKLSIKAPERTTCVTGNLYFVSWYVTVAHETCAIRSSFVNTKINKAYLYIYKVIFLFNPIVSLSFRKLQQRI